MRRSEGEDAAAPIAVRLQPLGPTTVKIRCGPASDTHRRSIARDNQKSYTAHSKSWHYRSRLPMICSLYASVTFLDAKVMSLMREMRISSASRHRIVSRHVACYGDDVKSRLRCCQIGAISLRTIMYVIAYCPWLNILRHRRVRNSGSRPQTSSDISESGRIVRRVRRFTSCTAAAHGW